MKQNKTTKKNPAQKNIQVIDHGDGTYTATSANSKYKIIYNRNICIGAASCAAIAPLTFFMDLENRALIVSDTDSFDDDEVILAAAQSCPVFAIQIVNKETGKIIFPIEE